MSDDTASSGEVNQRRAESKVDEIERELRLMEELDISDPYCFSSSTVIKSTFPHSYRSGKEMELVNGKLRVTMYCRHGLPYGRFPRIIMTFLTREALRRDANPAIPENEKRRIPLGKSLNGFLSEIGIIRGHYASGSKGKKRASGNDYKALREQMTRLFNTTIHMDWEVDNDGRAMTGWENVTVSERGYMWWDESDADNDVDEAFVQLTEEFYRDLVDHAVPLKASHVAQLYRSVMAFDLYALTCLKLATHSGFTRLSWPQLKGQLGTSYPDTDQGLRDFRKKVRLALAQIKEVWPEAGVEEWAGGVQFRGNEPAVPRRAVQEYRDLEVAHDRPRF